MPKHMNERFRVTKVISSALPPKYQLTHISFTKSTDRICGNNINNILKCFAYHVTHILYLQSDIWRFLLFSFSITVFFFFFALLYYLYLIIFLHNKPPHLSLSLFLVYIYIYIYMCVCVCVCVCVYFEVNKRGRSQDTIKSNTDIISIIKN